MPGPAVPTDFEALVEACIRRVLGPGDGAVDVGAHTGRHLRPMLEAVGPTGHVVAVEPLPDCVAALEADLAGHPGLTVVAGAVGLRREVVELVVAVDRPEESSLRARRVYSGPTDLATVAVEAHPLDELAAPLARVDLVKIDVEGAEALVLESGARTLRTHRPVVTFEHGPGIADFDGTTAGLYELVEDLGYALFTIDGAAVTSAAHMEEVADVGRLWDYVAIPTGHALLGALPAALATELAEGREVDAAVAEAYRTVLGRDPDTAGWAAFRPICREHGVEVVVAILRDSEEAHAREAPGST
ncbi:MAG TPA: FkbM family methyltransferase [Iamia sp.]|nr:FkbM family methyltransferase [Iamia sp.]